MASEPAGPYLVMMNSRRTTLERAYELANSGDCAGVNDIKTRLKAEGYHDAEGQLYGPSLGRSLRKLCDAARQAKAAEESAAEESAAADRAAS
jgi:hypothetical protein